MTITTLRNVPVKQYWQIYCLLILSLGFIFSIIIPPFQSPDEFDHVSRAYMLGHGQFVLHDKGDGLGSGGELDTGLGSYMRVFRPVAGHNQRKVSADEFEEAGTIRWSQSNSWVNPIGTGYYFPLVYAPAAVGLRLGEAVGLSVNQSYKVARLATLLATVGILVLAFRAYPPSNAVFAILLLPMWLYLATAISLDSIATAIAVLAIAAFLRSISDDLDTPSWITVALVAGIGLVAASRANFTPFLLLPFAAWWKTRDRRLLIGSVIMSLFVIGWTVVMIKTVRYPLSDPHNIDHSARLIHFVLHPGEFLGMLGSTLSDPAVRAYYVTSFIGALGWLDTSLATPFYYLLGSLAMIAFIACLARDAILEQWTYRGLLAVCSIGMVLLTFLALLVQWTVGDSAIIQGVQGRYFFIPVLALIYGLTADARRLAGISESFSRWLVITIAVMTLYSTTQAIIARYYTPLTQHSASHPAALTPSMPLTTEQAIEIRIDPDSTPANDPRRANLKAIEILLGTYARSNAGTATVALWNEAGDMKTTTINLASLTDNAYARIPVDGKNIRYGTIRSVDGTGISAWETHAGGVATTCIRYEYVDGTTLNTPGCP